MRVAALAVLGGVEVCGAFQASGTHAWCPRAARLTPSPLRPQQRAGPVCSAAGEGSGVDTKRSQTTGTSRRCLARRALLFAAVMTSTGGGLATSECSANAATESPRALTSKGMELFKSAKIPQSVAAFDRAIEIDPRYAGLLWQRGLSLYYADRFTDAAAQFARDVALNPRDTEEAVWALLSMARAEGGSWKGAQKDIIRIEGETRPYMKLVYEVCEGKEAATTLENLAAGLDPTLPPDEAKRSLASLPKRFKDTMRPQEAGFYFNLYAGLIAEAQGRADDAQRFMVKAVQSPYGSSGDYMWHLAKVHCITRGWEF